jgi:hypothetical protein
MLPCSLKQINDFLKSKITEQKMISDINKETKHHYDGLYLASAYINPKYRNKGIIFGAYREMFNYFKSKNENLILFGWIFKESGLCLLKKLSKAYKLKLKYLKQDPLSYHKELEKNKTNKKS